MRRRRRLPRRGAAATGAAPAKRAAAAARGLPAIRDALLTPLHLPGALLGGLFAPICLGWFSLTAAMLASALIPLSLALLLSVLIVAQGFWN